MKDLINKVIEAKMQDGTIEKIVADKIDDMVKDICEKQMRWGDAKKAMEEKLAPPSSCRPLRIATSALW